MKRSAPGHRPRPHLVLRRPHRAVARARGRKAGLTALVAVLGPGLLAGLSDDDPAGITTYSILGADYGYRLLWVVALSTAALIVFHELAARPIFVTYVISGVLAHPDWGATAHGLVVPGLPLTRPAVLAVVATIGTTLAPWGLAFIQSYVVDKRLSVKDLRYERIDVISGAALTGIIGVFVVVACAATLYANGQHVESASDAAAALEPLAGEAARTLFGLGLVGAALLAAALVPLSTAYSVAEAFDRRCDLNAGLRDAPLFYGSYRARCSPW